MRAKGLLVIAAVAGCAVAANDFEVSCQPILLSYVPIKS